MSKEKLRKWRANEQRIAVLRNTAAFIKSYRLRRKILMTALGCLISLTMVLFIGAALYMNTGSFTVGINKTDINKYGITLSDSRDMRYVSSRLNANISERITNISVRDLPENLDMIDGEHNGENYIAYTFYLMNAGESKIDCEYELAITNVYKGLDEAVRVRLYVDGEYTDYAKTSSDGSGPEPETTEFYSIGIVTKHLIEDMMPGDKVKFTIVIWLEGNDPDCVDRVLDGLADFDMKFTAFYKGEAEEA